MELKIPYDGARSQTPHPEGYIHALTCAPGHMRPHSRTYTDSRTQPEFKAKGTPQPYPRPQSLGKTGKDRHWLGRGRLHPGAEGLGLRGVQAERLRMPLC